MTDVRDMMTPDPLTLEQEESLRTAAELLTSAGIGGAPVVSGDHVVGVLSLTDILAFEADDPGVPTYRSGHPDPPGDDALGQFEPTEPTDAYARWFVEMWDDAGAEVTSRIDESGGPEWDALDEHTVAEVMSRRILSIHPDASLGDAAGIMEKEGVHRLLVVEDDEVVGIITTMDVVRAVARGVVDGEE